MKSFISVCFLDHAMIRTCSLYRGQEFEKLWLCMAMHLTETFQESKQVLVSLFFLSFVPHSNCIDSDA